MYVCIYVCIYCMYGGREGWMDERWMEGWMNRLDRTWIPFRNLVSLPWQWLPAGQVVQLSMWVLPGVELKVPAGQARGASVARGQKRPAGHRAWSGLTAPPSQWYPAQHSPAARGRGRHHTVGLSVLICHQTRSGKMAQQSHNQLAECTKLTPALSPNHG